MKKLKIGASPLTKTIFAGTLLKDGKTWAADKQDVTMDALAAVIEHCLYHANDNNGAKVELTAGCYNYTISVKKSRKGTGAK